MKEEKKFNKSVCLSEIYAYFKAENSSVTDEFLLLLLLDRNSVLWLLNQAHIVFAYACTITM